MVIDLIYHRIVYNSSLSVLPVAMTHWIYNWKLNGWKTVQGTDVRNVDDFLRLDCLMKNIDMK